MYLDGPVKLTQVSCRLDERVLSDDPLLAVAADGLSLQTAAGIRDHKENRPMVW